MATYSVLIVEDDADLGNLLKQYLGLNNFAADRVFNGEEAREALGRRSYDILILDVMMPREDGFTLAASLRKLYPQVPFLFVTARKMKADIIEGLRLGADDYMVKPFDADELVLRLHNILRRTHPQQQPATAYQIGRYLFEPHNLLLSSPTGQRMLTEKEAQLLLYFYQNCNQVIKRTDILNHLWQEADFFKGRSMDVFVSRLRKYLSEDPAITIESVRGIGFRCSF